MIGLPRQSERIFMFEQILSCVKAYDRIIIHRHQNPDGDALGSQIGLKHILQDSFPQKQIRMVGDMTPRYAFMEDAVMDTVPDSPPVKFIETNVVKSFKIGL